MSLASYRPETTGWPTWRATCPGCSTHLLMTWWAANTRTTWLMPGSSSSHTGTGDIRPDVSGRRRQGDETRKTHAQELQRDSRVHARARGQRPIHLRGQRYRQDHPGRRLSVVAVRQGFQ